MKSSLKQDLRHKLTEGFTSLFSRSRVYVPLKSDSSIRLLRIHGNHGGDGTIRCTMTEADLDEKPLYEALSYTWQKDQSGLLEVVSMSSKIGKVAKQFEKLSNIGVGSETIICNDQYLKVTPNLHDALLQLRKRSQRRTAIWIDAMCIDQTNIRERNAQVNMMGRIFDSAQQVVVWLGKATENTLRTIEYMEKLPALRDQKPEDVQNECTALIKYDPNVEDAEKQESHEPKTSFELILSEFLRRKGPKEWLYLFKLFRARWFRRTWVLQEIVLAKQLQFYIGPHEVSLETLEKGLHRLLDIGSYASQITDKHMRTFPMSQHLESIRMMLEARSYHVQHQLWPLERCVGLARSRECGDARDKVFAILSISSTDSLYLPLRHKDRSQSSTNSDTGLLQADYSKATPHVYLDCFRCLLANIGPDALSLVDQNYDRSLELPTWVPDFNAPLWPKPFKDYGTAVYSPSGTSNPEIRISRTGRTLSLRASLWDSVYIVSEGLPKVLFLSFANSSDRVRGIFKLLENKIGPTYAPTGEPTRMAFARTLLADLFKDIHPAPTEVIEMFGGVRSPSKFAVNRNDELRGQRRRKRRGASSPGTSPKPARRFSDSEIATEEIATEPAVDDGLLKPTTRPELGRSRSTTAAKSEFPVTETALSTSIIPPNEPPTKVPYTSTYNWNSKSGTFNSTHTGTAPRYHHSEVSELLYDINAGRRWFLTKKGYLGLGPETLQPGDKLVLIPGASLPYILQSTGKKGGEGLQNWEEGEFTLVGESYVHGLMHGEALEKDISWKRISIK